MYIQTYTQNLSKSHLIWLYLHVKQRGRCLSLKPFIFGLSTWSSVLNVKMSPHLVLPSFQFQNPIPSDGAVFHTLQFEKKRNITLGYLSQQNHVGDTHFSVLVGSTTHGSTCLGVLSFVFTLRKSSFSPRISHG